MKKLKILLLGAALFASSSLFAQVNYGNLLSAPTHAVIDTAVLSPVSQVVEINGFWDLVTIQPTFTKISGTVGGTTALYGSVDNVGYSIIDSAITLTNVASQTFVWKITPSAYRFYKLVTTPTGTMSVKFSTPYIIRKPLIR